MKDGLGYLIVIVALVVIIILISRACGDLSLKIANDLSVALTAQPSEIERRDARIQECMALERYTLEQCIQITGDNK